jgi:hypothetical protein
VPADLERLVDVLAADGSATTALVLWHSLRRTPPVWR